MSTKQCRQCSKTFKLEAEDLAFYKKVAVPPPTLCPDCRQQRRLAWRNERNLYQRTCALCQKNIISNYSPDKPYTIYCSDCWWSDRWNPLDYGQAVDFSRPFYDQVNDILRKIPLLALVVVKCDNADYTNYSYENKNCYLSFDMGGNENIYYSRTIYKSRDCFDCLSLKDGCELCYQSVYCTRCYNCTLCIDCDNVRDSLFSFNCVGSSNLAFCYNLRAAHYCIDNIQYTPEDYVAKLKLLQTSRHSEFERLKQRFFEEKKKYIHRFAKLVSCENSSGDHLDHCSNTHYAFNTDNCENAKYVYDNVGGKDFYDDNYSGWGDSLFYETLGIAKPSRSKFLISCGYVTDVNCTLFSQNLTDCFGCVAMKGGRNYILNKAYEPKEYQQVVSKLIAHMRTTGEWGELFPAAMSPFAYNETVAHEVYPLSEAEVKQRGWEWKRDETKHYQVQTYQVPNDIQAVLPDITRALLACTRCQKNYKILPAELAFYQRQQLPIPAQCPDCRHLERRSWVNPYQLWQRQCMCTQVDHGHAGRCATELETTYSPEHLELIYCEPCYQREIY